MKKDYSYVLPMTMEMGESQVIINGIPQVQKVVNTVLYCEECNCVICKFDGVLKPEQLEEVCNNFNSNPDSVKHCGSCGKRLYYGIKNIICDEYTVVEEEKNNVETENKNKDKGENE